MKHVPEIIGMRGGIPLYAFVYPDSDEVRIGFMAEDVKKVMPEAVVLGADGFDRVNYRMVLEATRPH